MNQTLKAAAVQMNSASDKAANLAIADRLVRAAADEGATLVLLPEKFNLMGTHAEYRAGAETLSGETVQWAQKVARERGIELIAGSFVESVPGQEKLANTCVHVRSDGEIAAVYRKIHMFDVEVGGQVYRESESEQHGDEIVLTTVANDDLAIGLSVCYDLRFPELYRILTVRGAQVLSVPAAFTYVTGEAHWELLLRARAIENQTFVIAADQHGIHGGDKRSWGHSMIVDPWGEILAEAGDSEDAVVVAELDFARQAEIRTKLPSVANRVPSAYKWD